MFQRFYDYQREREAKTNQKVLLFSILAGAAGLAAGYLSNKENRDQVKKVAKGVAQKAQEYSEEASTKAQELTKTAAESAKDLTKNAGTKIKEVQKKAVRKLNELEDRIDSAFNKETDIELVPVRDQDEE